MTQVQACKACFLMGVWEGIQEVRLLVLTAAIMKVDEFWDVMSCSLVEVGHIRPSGNFTTSVTVSIVFIDTVRDEKHLSPV
jgi:hypothetical protein